MKITDTLGRTLVIQVVVPGPRGWMTPLGYNIENAPTRFSRVPHGPFGIQVMSKEGAELIVHLNGERLLDAAVPGGIHILEVDKDGKKFMFQPLGANAVDHCPEMPSANALLAKPEAKPEATADGAESAVPQPQVFQAPTGHGLVFVVARFAEDKGPLPHPPRQEYLVAEQVCAPADHDMNMAGNLRRVVQPDLPPNLDDLTCHEPSEHKLAVTQCLTCGRHH